MIPHGAACPHRQPRTVGRRHRSFRALRPRGPSLGLRFHRRALRPRIERRTRQLRRSFQRHPAGYIERKEFPTKTPTLPPPASSARSPKRRSGRWRILEEKMSGPAQLVQSIRDICLWATGLLDSHGVSARSEQEVNSEPSPLSVDSYNLLTSGTSITADPKLDDLINSQHSCFFAHSDTMRPFELS
ncbi:hypothetical protein LUTEI9C_140078 [Luteimonas sp. 9C]|nr:hypothetical protein LUTEI9C_140078 [Luteimonas sp. 9C]